MAQSVDDSVKHSNRAPRACSNCKKNKKRCDKKLPACGNCPRKRTSCHYDVATPYSDAVGNTAHAERVLTAATSSGESDITLILTDRLSDITSELLSSTNLQTSDTVDRRVHSQVLSLIEGTGLYVDDITSRYFHGVHKWLPILSRPRFNLQVLSCQISPSAAFAILLLSMALVSQHPSSSSSIEDNPEPMYISTKMLFAQVQAFTPHSLPLIQAGILITTYERGHNLFEAAYVSIGICARMAFAMGLQRRRNVMEQSDREAWSQLEEEKNVWWGIVICDRIIGCESSIRGRPLAVDHPRADDELPLEAADLDQATHRPFTDIRHFASTQSISDIGAFGREAQATYLLSRVLDFVNPTRLSLSMPQDVLVLDTELQAFLSSLVSQCAGIWRIYCGAMAMCITALFTLHDAVLSHSSKAIPLNRFNNCSSSALSTLARIVIDMSYSFNRDISNFDISTLSPSCSHIIRAVLEHNKIAAGSRDDIWNHDFDTLKKTLGYFQQRWPLAGKRRELLGID